MADDISNDELSKYEQDKISTMKRLVQQRAVWKKEMKANVAMQKYFEDFEPKSVESFIDTYLLYKSNWTEHGPYCGEWKEEEDLRWIQSAFEHLGYIQQKKLFDAQCRWRANLVVFDEIKIAWDFDLLDNDVLNCSFLEPITADDISMYTQYLLQSDLDLENYSSIRWQAYDDMKKADQNDGETMEIPDWYLFHNNRTGNGMLMQLPDLRSNKEDFYTRLWDENQPKKTATAVNTQRDTRPYLHYYSDPKTELFIKTFESKEVQQWYKDYEYANNTRQNEMDTIEEMTSLLLTSDDPVPIKANSNWIKALEDAVHAFKIKKLIEALPQAWEQYCFTLQSGISFFYEDRYSFQDLRQQMIDRILAGRKLNGEPEDFNF